MASKQGFASAFSTAVAAAFPERAIGAAIRSAYPRVEPELAQLGSYVPRGGVALDVGAWYGPWTSRLTRFADSVVAIEPTSKLASHLRLAFPAVQVVEAVASDHVGTAILHVPSAGPIVGTSSIEYGEGVDAEVKRITIDSLGLSDVKFIKLDVEGHELPALRGAAATIDRYSPILLVELEERIQPLQPVLDLLGGMGYQGYVLPQRTWIPLADIDLVAHQRAAIARVSQSFVRRVVWPRPRYINSVLFRRA